MVLLPQSRPNRGWTLALSVGLGIVVFATLPPFVGEAARGYLMEAFSAVCHQLPARSPSVDGVSLAVCHRCYGIYWGLPAAAMAFLAFRGRTPPRQLAPIVLGASVLPMVFDWGGDLLGLFTNSPGSRVVTGLVFGLVAGYFFVLALVDAFAKRSTE